MKNSLKVWQRLIFILLCYSHFGITIIGAATNKAKWTRMAVIAACPKGLDGESKLRYAYDDADRISQVLSGLGDITPENLFIFKQEDMEVFRKNLSRAGNRLASLKAKGEKVMIQFYYTGHGGPKGFHVGGETLSLAETRAILGLNLSDARLLVLDVCYGASFFAKGFKSVAPLKIEIEKNGEDQTRGEVTISSSAVDEQAFEMRSMGGSVFTSHWMLALRGAADKNGDGQVSLFEAYGYAYDRTVYTTTKELANVQHPSYQMDIQGLRDMTLSRVTEGAANIQFISCPAGAYSILDLNKGLSLGELHLDGKSNFVLALEPASYEVKYRFAQNKEKSATVTVDLSRGDTKNIGPEDFKNSQNSIALGKGEADSLETINKESTRIVNMEEAKPDMPVEETSEKSKSHLKRIAADEVADQETTVTREEGEELVEKEIAGKAESDIMIKNNTPVLKPLIHWPSHSFSETNHAKNRKFKGGEALRLGMDQAYSVISEKSFRSALSEPRPHLENFSITPHFGEEKTDGLDFRFWLQYPLFERLNFGLEYGKSKRVLQGSGSGHEPVPGLDGKFDVTWTEEWILSDQAFGVVLGTPLYNTERFGIDFEYHLNWLAEELESISQTKRPLLETEDIYYKSYDRDGYRHALALQGICRNIVSLGFVHIGANASLTGYFKNIEHLMGTPPIEGPQEMGYSFALGLNLALEKNLTRAKANPHMQQKQGK